MFLLKNATAVLRKMILTLVYFYKVTRLLINNTVPVL